MKKLSKKKVTDLIVQSTIDYTDAYFNSYGGGGLDKKLWAALHIGIIAGLKAGGYEEKSCLESLNEAIKIISKLENNPQT